MLGIIGLMSALIIASVVVGDLMLQKQSKKLVHLKLENEVIENQQTALIQAKKDVQKYTELKNIAKQIVPQDKDQARATREIVNLANQAGIKISSIGFPASTLGQANPNTATTSTPTGTTTATNTAPPVSQVKPVTGINGVDQLDIIVTSDTNSPSTYNQVINFLQSLEQNRRTAQVSQISIQPDNKNRSLLNFNLTITLYIKPWEIN